MMGGGPPYSDILRIIGRFLDEQSARNIEVVDRGSHYTVAWSGLGLDRWQRTYRAFELEDLRAEARASRGLGGQRPQRMIAEALRALGTLCEEAGIARLSLTETSEGFRITGLAGGHHVSRLYTRSDVERLISAQRARRADPGLSPPSIAS